MNAGKDYRKAKKQAKANANHDGKPRWLHIFCDTYWISKSPPQQWTEKIDPSPKK